MVTMRHNLRIEEKLQWGRLASPRSDTEKVPFNWYIFKNGFGSELVYNVLTNFGLSVGDVVFDPFCGGGTTLVQAKLSGYNSMGLDISPFSVFLSNVLTRSYNPERLTDYLKKIPHKINARVYVPDVSILRKSFTDLSLKYIYSLRDSIISLDSSYRDFFLFSLLSILNSVSKAKKSGGFLRITGEKKASVDTIKITFLKTTQKFINDMKYLNYPKRYARAVLGDARDYPAEVKQQEYDAILTSPPYPNRHDYTRIYELELLVGFIRDNPSLKSLRYDTLRSHVEAKKKYEAFGYAPPALLEKKISELHNRELNNRQIISTLYGYFEDMYLCLKQMFTVIKKGKYVGLVVSNVRFAGVMIPVDILLSQLAEQVGLRTQRIYVLRYKGNSSQQMREHNREPARESLVIWKK